VRGFLGLLLALAGAAWLFVPWSNTSLGRISIWQSHDLCSSFLGAFAPAECSSVTQLWAIGLGAIVIGVLAILTGGRSPAGSPPPPREPQRPPVEPPPLPIPRQATPEPLGIAAARDERSPEGLPTRPFRFEEPPKGPGEALRILAWLIMLAGVALALLGLSVLLSNRAALAPAPGVREPSLRAAIASPLATPAAPFGGLAEVPVIPCATTYGGGDIQRPTPPTENLALPPGVVDRELGLEFLIRTFGLPMSPDRCSERLVLFGGFVNLAIACPFFPDAARLQQQDFGVTCSTPPPGENVTHHGLTVARFQDPPGVAGNAAGSGGAYAGEGAAWYADSAARITCVLAPEDASLCDLAIDDWLRRLGSPG